MPRPWALFIDSVGVARLSVCQSCRIGLGGARATRSQNRRLPVVRSVTESMDRFRKRDLVMLDTGSDDREIAALRAQRPVTRGDCEKGERPCAFVSCRYHLFLDVDPITGSIKYNRPDLEPDQMTESCVLDVADRGETTLEEVGVIMNVTRERARQLEARAMERMGKRRSIRMLGADLDKGMTHKFEPSESDDFLTADEARKMNIANTAGRFRGAPVRHLTDRIGEVLPPLKKARRRIGALAGFGDHHAMKAAGRTPVITDETEVPRASEKPSLAAAPSSGEVAAASKALARVDAALSTATKALERLDASDALPERVSGIERPTLRGLRRALGASVAAQIVETLNASPLEADAVTPPKRGAASASVNDTKQEGAMAKTLDDLSENQRAIVEAYKKDPSPTRVAKECRTTPATVTTLIVRLRKEGLVTVRGRAPVGSGKTARKSRATAAKTRPQTAAAPKLVRSEDPIVTQLRDRLVAIDVERKRIVGALVALGAEG